MRKVWLALATVVMCLPMLMTTVAARTEVTDVHWVTRIDAPIPFVRVVLSLSSPTDATATIDKSGLNTTIVLKNAEIKGAPSQVKMDKSIASSVSLAEKGKNVNVNIKTPSSIDENDVKVFSLTKDTVNNKPYRMVIDIQKKGVAPTDMYYGSDKWRAAKVAREAKKKPVAPQATTNTVKYRTSGGIAGKIITIDPGHGGSDPGAIGPTGVQEKDVTLPIAKALKKALEAKGAKVFMTRTTDVDVYAPNASGPDELQARVNVGNYNSSDLFVSVHINSFTNPNVGGIATYYYDKTPYDTKLASRIQSQIAGESGFGGDRGIQPGNLYVLRHSAMPAVLVELGFISNPSEEALLKTEKTQENFADEIAAGIENYFRG